MWRNCVGGRSSSHLMSAIMPSTSRLRRFRVAKGGIIGCSSGENGDRRASRGSRVRTRRSSGLGLRMLATGGVESGIAFCLRSGCKSGNAMGFGSWFLGSAETGMTRWEGRSETFDGITEISAPLECKSIAASSSLPVCLHHSSKLTRHVQPP